MEQDLVPGRRENDGDRLVRVGEDPSQGIERASWDDDARLLHGVQDGDRLDRDPIVVGRGQGELGTLEASQNACQDRSGFVRRRGEGDFGESLAQDILGDASRRFLTRGRDGRELLGINPLDSGLESARLDVKGLLRLELQIDAFVGRQACDDVGQESGGRGRRPADLDLAGYPVGHPDLEVGRGQLEAAVLGSKEDVVQDGQRAPRRDGTTYDLETSSQVLLHDREFHFGFTPLRSDVAGRPESGWRAALLLVVDCPSIFSSRHHHHHGVETVHSQRGHAHDGGGRVLPYCGWTTSNWGWLQASFVDEATGSSSWVIWGGDLATPLRRTEGRFLHRRRPLSTISGQLSTEPTDLEAGES